MAPIAARVRLWLEELRRTRLYKIDARLYRWSGPAALLFWGILWLVESTGQLRNSFTPRGLASLALTGEPWAMAEVLDRWAGAQVTAAFWSVQLDVLLWFPFAAFLIGSCRSATAFFEQQAAGQPPWKRGLARWGGRILTASFAAAAVAEMVENQLLFGLITGDPPGVVGPWLRGFAAAKWITCLPAMLFVLMALWHFLKERGVLEVVEVIRFSYFMSLLAPLLLLQEQAQEALRTLAEDQIDPAKRGLVLFAFIALAYFAYASWVCARLLVADSARAPSNGEGAARRWAEAWLPRICLIAPFALTALALWLASLKVPRLQDPLGLLPVLSPGSRWLQGAALGSALVALLLLAAGEGLERIATRRFGWLASGHLTPLRIGLWLTMLLAPAVALFLLLACAGSQWTVSYGPTAVLFAGLSMVVPLGSLLSFLSRQISFPILTAAILAAAGFSFADANDNHRARLAPAPGKLMDVEAAFRTWLDARRDLDRYRHEGRITYPVVFVSAQGGGIYAAYHAGMTLAALQQNNPGFARHTFAISGVSGGSLGSAVFAGLARRHFLRSGGRARGAAPAPEVDLRPRGWVDEADEVLRHDFLTPVLASFLSPDLIQRFWPWPVDRFDRARALEGAFERAWNDATGGDEFSRPFHELYGIRTAGDEIRLDGSVPLLFLNTTRVETGDRIVISPVAPTAPSDEGGRPIDASCTDPATGRPRTTRKARGFNGLISFDMVDSSIAFPLSTAVGLTARFPYVTPSGSVPVFRRDPLPRIVKYRCVDGGYFENSGVSTMMDLIRGLDPAKPVRTRRHGLVSWYPVALRIGAEIGGTAREIRQFQDGKPRIVHPEPAWCPVRSSPGAGLDELLAPVSALYKARDGRATLSEEQMRSTLRELSPLAVLADVNLQTRTVPLPLGWLLSRAAREEIQRQLLLLEDTRETREHEVVAQNRSAMERVRTALAPPAGALRLPPRKSGTLRRPSRAPAP